MILVILYKKISWKTRVGYKESNFLTDFQKDFDDYKQTSPDLYDWNTYECFFLLFFC